MGVEVDGKPDLLLQGVDQGEGGGGSADNGHVLYAEDMGAGALQLLGQIDIILQVVFTAVGIADSAGVADRRLAQGAGFQHRIHRHPHVLDPVEGIEDTEHVDARGRRALNEIADHIVRVVGIADRVGGAQQHLQQQVRHRRAQQLQTFPRAFVEETHGDVEGGAAPAFDRE